MFTLIQMYILFLIQIYENSAKTEIILKTIQYQ